MGLDQSRSESAENGFTHTQNQLFLQLHSVYADYNCLVASLMSVAQDHDDLLLVRINRLLVEPIERRRAHVSGLMTMLKHSVDAEQEQ